jgi:hypothetical protein
LIEGNSPSDLAECVRFCAGTIKEKGLNRNWHVAMSMFFLAEAATKAGVSPELKSAWTEAAAIAAREQEPTGGWCHYKGMAKERKYVETLSGGEDIAILTCMIYASCLEMKALGVESGGIADKARKNLESLREEFGFHYGTRASWSKDPCMSRAGTVLMALAATGKTDDPWYAPFSEGLQRRFGKCADGHSFGAIHYFATAAAMHRLGPEVYRKFADKYLDELIGAQNAQGVVALAHDGKVDGWGKDEVASTAVLASIILMQKEGAFVPKPKRK